MPPPHHLPSTIPTACGGCPCWALQAPAYITVRDAAADFTHHLPRWRSRHPFRSTRLSRQPADEPPGPCHTFVRLLMPLAVWPSGTLHTAHTDHYGCIQNNDMDFLKGRM